MYLRYMQRNALDYLRKNLEIWKENHRIFKDFLTRGILSTEETSALFEEASRKGMIELAALILEYGRKGES